MGSFDSWPRKGTASCPSFADQKSKQDSDFPAWSEYRKVVGDTPITRQLFGEMLAAEPELCAAVGGDPGRLGGTGWPNERRC